MRVQRGLFTPTGRACLGGALLLVLSFGAIQAVAADVRLGISGFTFHQQTLFEALDKTSALGLKYYGGFYRQIVSENIPKNLDYTLTDEEIAAVRDKLRSSDIEMPTYYFHWTGDVSADDETCLKVFEFCKALGVETIIGEPDPEALDFIEKLCDKYKINVAIHNHTAEISTGYWDPTLVLRACEGRSKRIGACPDMGHWIRAGIDPIEGLRTLKDHVITVHLRDVHELGPEGRDVPWGTGKANVETFIREVQRLGIKPTLWGMEYAYEFSDLEEGITHNAKFFDGIMRDIESKPTGEIRLIVQGDDMGSARAANEAFIKCYKEGVLRTAEVMVPGPWFEEAVRLLAENPGIDVGVHLTLTSEWDNVKWRPLTQTPSLMDESENFPQTVWSGYMPGASSLEEMNPPVEDIEKELRAQIELAMKKIKNVTHLTNHMGGATYREDLKDMVTRLGREYNLLTRAHIAEKVTFVGPEDVADTSFEEAEAAFVKTLEGLKPGLYISVEHPGLDLPEMRAIGHPGYENVAEHRDKVTRILTSRRVKDTINQQGIKLITYGDLRRD